MIEKFPRELFIKKKEIEEKFKYFSDPLFRFDPERHKYTYNGEEFDSVTRFIATFKDEFKEDYWAEIKAAQRNITKEEILLEWKDKRDRSNELGKSVHEWIENFWNKWDNEIIRESSEFDNIEIEKRYKKFLDIYNNKLNLFVPLKSELKMFSKKWKLAGTVDQPLLFWDKKQNKVLLVIGDWKTNGQFNDDSNEKGRYQKLKKPFSAFFANHHNEYSIQICLYRLMLEEIGIETHSGFLCHIGPDEPAKLYEAKDFREILKIYLNHTR